MTMDNPVVWTGVEARRRKAVRYTRARATATRSSSKTTSNDKSATSLVNHSSVTGQCDRQPTRSFRLIVRSLHNLLGANHIFLDLSTKVIRFDVPDQKHFQVPTSQNEKRLLVGTNDGLTETDGRSKREERSSEEIEI